MFWIVTNKSWLIGSILVTILGQPILGLILIIFEIWRTNRMIDSLPSNITKEDLKKTYGEGHIKFLSKKEQIEKIKQQKSRTRNWS